MGASTNSNFACQYNFPGTLAPMADFGLLEKAVLAARAKKVNVRVGPVFSSDMFTTPTPPPTRPFGRWNAGR
jgi:purine-nucleoside phosphorylase